MKYIKWLMSDGGWKDFLACLAGLIMISGSWLWFFI